MSIAELFSEYGLDYLLAFLMTIALTVISFALALILGILVTVMKVSCIKPVRIAGNIYVQIFRNIPGSALLIFLVYALPYLNMVFSYYACVIIATTLIPSAFASDNLISGINTISKGQIEAARSLGMTFSQIIRRIVIPQAIRSSILQLTNLLIATMLTTAIASQVPVDPRELTGIVAHINTYSTGGIAAFAISAFFYCATAVLIGFAGNKIHKKFRILR